GVRDATVAPLAAAGPVDRALAGRARVLVPEVVREPAELALPARAHDRLGRDQLHRIAPEHALRAVRRAVVHLPGALAARGLPGPLRPLQPHDEEVAVSAGDDHLVRLVGGLVGAPTPGNTYVRGAHRARACEKSSRNDHDEDCDPLHALSPSVSLAI